MSDALNNINATVDSYLRRWFEKIPAMEPRKANTGYMDDVMEMGVSPYKDGRPIQYDPRAQEETKSYLKGTGATIDDVAKAEFSGVRGYRANPKNRYGAKDGLETQPTEFDFGGIIEFLTNTSAMRREAGNGIPQLSPQEIAAFALKEGYADGHVNGIDWNNGESLSLFKSLQKKYPERVAQYLVKVKEKSDVAKKLGKPFAEVWNGTGTNGYGQTGSEYAGSYEDFLKAANHPKNKALIDFITEAGKK